MDDINSNIAKWRSNGAQTRDFIASTALHTKERMSENPDVVLARMSAYDARARVLRQETKNAAGDSSSVPFALQTSIPFRGHHRNASLKNMPTTTLEQSLTQITHKNNHHPSSGASHISFGGSQILQSNLSHPTRVSRRKRTSTIIGSQPSRISQPRRGSHRSISQDTRHDKRSLYSNHKNTWDNVSIEPASHVGAPSDFSVQQEGGVCMDDIQSMMNVEHAVGDTSDIETEGGISKHFIRPKRTSIGQASFYTRETVSQQKRRILKSMPALVLPRSGDTVKQQFVAKKHDIPRIVSSTRETINPKILARLKAFRARNLLRSQHIRQKINDTQSKQESGSFTARPRLESTTHKNNTKSNGKKVRPNSIRNNKIKSNAATTNGSTDAYTNTITQEATTMEKALNHRDTEQKADTSNQETKSAGRTTNNDTTTTTSAITLTTSNSNNNNKEAPKTKETSKQKITNFLENNDQQSTATKPSNSKQSNYVQNTSPFMIRDTFTTQQSTWMAPTLSERRAHQLSDAIVHNQKTYRVRTVGSRTDASAVLQKAGIDLASYRVQELLLHGSNVNVPLVEDMTIHEALCLAARHTQDRKTQYELLAIAQLNSIDPSLIAEHMIQFTQVPMSTHDQTQLRSMARSTMARSTMTRNTLEKNEKNQLSRSSSKYQKRQMIYTNLPAPWQLRSITEANDTDEKTQRKKERMAFQRDVVGFLSPRQRDRVWQVHEYYSTMQRGATMNDTNFTNDSSSPNTSHSSTLEKHNKQSLKSVSRTAMSTQSPPQQQLRQQDETKNSVTNQQLQQQEKKITETAQIGNPSSTDTSSSGQQKDISSEMNKLSTKSIQLPYQRAEERRLSPRFAKIQTNSRALGFHVYALPQDENGPPLETIVQLRDYQHDTKSPQFSKSPSSRHSSSKHLTSTNSRMNHNSLPNSEHQIHSSPLNNNQYDDLTSPSTSTHRDAFQLLRQELQKSNKRVKSLKCGTSSLFSTDTISSNDDKGLDRLCASHSISYAYLPNKSTSSIENQTDFYDSNKLSQRNNHMNESQKTLTGHILQTSNSGHLDFSDHLLQVQTFSQNVSKGNVNQSKSQLPIQKKNMDHSAYAYKNMKWNQTKMQSYDTTFEGNDYTTVSNGQTYSPSSETMQLDRSAFAPGGLFRMAWQHMGTPALAKDLHYPDLLAMEPSNTQNEEKVNFAMSVFLPLREGGVGITAGTRGEESENEEVEFEPQFRKSDSIKAQIMAHYKPDHIEKASASHVERAQKEAVLYRTLGVTPRRTSVVGDAHALAASVHAKTMSQKHNESSMGFGGTRRSYVSEPKLKNFQYDDITPLCQVTQALSPGNKRTHSVSISSSIDTDMNEHLTNSDTNCQLDPSQSNMARNDSHTTASSQRTSRTRHQNAEIGEESEVSSKVSNDHSPMMDDRIDTDCYSETSNDIYQSSVGGSHYYDGILDRLPVRTPSPEPYLPLTDRRPAAPPVHWPSLSVVRAQDNAYNTRQSSSSATKSEQQRNISQVSSKKSPRKSLSRSKSQKKHDHTIERSKSTQSSKKSHNQNTQSNKKKSGESTYQKALDEATQAQMPVFAGYSALASEFLEAYRNGYQSSEALNPVFSMEDAQKRYDAIMSSWMRNRTDPEPKTYHSNGFDLSSIDSARNKQTIKQNSPHKQELIKTNPRQETLKHRSFQDTSSNTVSVSLEDDSTVPFEEVPENLDEKYFKWLADLGIQKPFTKPVSMHALSQSVRRLSAKRSSANDTTDTLLQSKISQETTSTKQKAGQQNAPSYKSIHTKVDQHITNAQTMKQQDKSRTKSMDQSDKSYRKHTHQNNKSRTKSMDQPYKSNTKNMKNRYDRNNVNKDKTLASITQSKQSSSNSHKKQFNDDLILQHTENETMNGQIQTQYSIAKSPIKFNSQFSSQIPQNDSASSSQAYSHEDPDAFFAITKETGAVSCLPLPDALQVVDLSRLSPRLKGKRMNDLNCGDQFEAVRAISDHRLARMLASLVKSREETIDSKFAALSRICNLMDLKNSAREDLSLMRFDAELARIVKQRHAFGQRGQWFGELLQRLNQQQYEHEVTPAQRFILLAVKDTLACAVDISPQFLLEVLSVLPQDELFSPSVQVVLAFLRRVVGISLVDWTRIHAKLALMPPVESLIQIRHEEQKHNPKPNDSFPNRFTRKVSISSYNTDDSPLKSGTGSVAGFRCSEPTTTTHQPPTTSSGLVRVRSEFQPMSARGRFTSTDENELNETFSKCDDSARVPQPVTASPSSPNKPIPPSKKQSVSAQSPRVARGQLHSARSSSQVSDQQPQKMEDDLELHAALQSDTMINQLRSSTIVTASPFETTSDKFGAIMRRDSTVKLA